MIPIAPGSDGAGSIRVPASFCGLVGVKPGRGALFNEHRNVDVGDIAAIGPLAHSVRDAAALMDVLDGRPVAGGAGSFLEAAGQAPPRLRIRLGVATPLASVDPEIEEATRRTGKRLQSMGHTVEEGPPPPDIRVDEFLPIMARLMANIPLLPFTSHVHQPTTRWMRELGRRLTNREAMERQAALQRRIDAWFQDGETDAWICPTAAELPPRVGRYRGLDGEATFRAVVPLGAFTAGFNVSGQPALSLPAGVSKSGLPIGVQLVMMRGEERKLLGLAAALEPLM
jgi:amidase